MDRIVNNLHLIVLAAMLLFLMVLILRNLVYGVLSRWWSTTIGTFFPLVGTDLDQRFTPESHVVGRIHSNVPIVRYRYIADGVEYRSGKFALDLFFANSGSLLGKGSAFRL